MTHEVYTLSRQELLNMLDRQARLIADHEGFSLERARLWGHQFSELVMRGVGLKDGAKQDGSQYVSICQAEIVAQLVERLRVLDNEWPRFFSLKTAAQARKDQPELWRAIRRALDKPGAGK